MKLEEYMRENRLFSQEDLRLHLRSNSMMGRLPVAIASCPRCHEVLIDYTKPCPVCYKEDQKSG